MKVLVDLTYIHPDDAYSGIAVFSYSMLPALRDAAPEIQLYGLVNPANCGLIRDQMPWLPQIMLRQRNIHALQNVNPYLNKRTLDRLISDNGIDIFLLPYFGDRCLRTSKAPTVAVMHDAQGFKVAPNKLRLSLYRIFTSAASKHVARMVTISEFARRDIEDHLPGLKAPIRVINQSLPLHSSAADYHPDTVHPYILSVNTLVAYKGPLTIIKAYQRIKDGIPHRLLFKGLATSYSEEVLKPYITAHNLQDRVHIIDQVYTPEQMESLYRGASLFVSASTMEGFGLTPLEAAMRGVPVICADIPAVRETSLGLLHYYSPAADEGVLASEMASMLSSPADMQDVADKLEKHYTPRRQAESYRALLHQIYGL